jgi:hypothetical protein
VPADHDQHPGTLTRGGDHIARGLGDEPGAVADPTEVQVCDPVVACMVRHCLLASTARRAECPLHSRPTPRSGRLARRAGGDGRTRNRGNRLATECLDADQPGRASTSATVGHSAAPRSPTVSAAVGDDREPPLPAGLGHQGVGIGAEGRSRSVEGPIA